MSVFALPVRRPVATAMLFLGLLLMGVIAWLRIPVELMPAITGEELHVQFFRPGSEPEAVEREILLPLEARVSTLPRVDETWAEIRDSAGTLTVRFEPGTDIKVRELDLRRLASELVRAQPRGTVIEVSALDLTAYSRFVMYVQVTGMEDRNSLLDFVDQRVVPRLLAVSGVSRVMAGGGAPREMSVRIDPDRCAALSIAPEQVAFAISRTVGRESYLGGVEDEAGRTALILDGRSAGAISLGATRVDPARPILLHHVSDVQLGIGREEMMFRVNGNPTVALIVFQDEGANLIRLGRELRAKMDALHEEFRPYGLDFVVNFDSAELVGEQLRRLQGLAASGFVIALIVLFLFLRQGRAVGVVATAVPASLLIALALLFLGGQTLNLITLFGLAVGIGMLVDNSIVVYEAVQRGLERGASPDRAAEAGVRRTVRAILAASTCNAIVFLPIVFADFEQPMVRSLLGVMALAIILPVAGSALVAVGLVPLLARRLAAPAALARIAAGRRRRERQAGLVAPDPARGLFTGLLMSVLRRPGGWIGGICFAVVITFIVTATWFATGVGGQEPPEAETIRLAVTLERSGSLEAAAAAFARLEGSAMELEGVKTVESLVREDGGALTVHLKPEGERPAGLNAARVRQVIVSAARELEGVEVEGQQSGLGPGGGSGGGGGGGGGGLAQLLGQAPARVVLSGPDADELNALAREVAESLESIPEVASATPDVRQGQYEYRVAPDAQALTAFGLTADQVLPALGVVRREGVEMRTGFTLDDGREIPLVLRREPGRARAGDDLRALRLSTPAGVLPLDALAEVRLMPPAPAVVHHDGRREVGVSYVLGPDAPTSGPSRVALEEQIRAALQNVHRPAGYTIETPAAEATFGWFRRILVPVLLLLFAVLAVTFESLTMPLLVLLALPLTLLGATWALVLSGTPPDMMALVGALALIGLTVNPAILLVDRMQQRAFGGRSAGAAAMAAVRERTRAVLMTTGTTVAGLWPLALATGRENEIWPPFAIIVMGGLVTSTLLTLLVIPVGFVFLRRLDETFGRLGPWVVIGWSCATAAIVVPLFELGVVTSLMWQLATIVLVAALLLAVVALALRRVEPPRPEAHDGPPEFEVRFLSKIYGRPGPVGRAWRAGERFAARVLALGGEPFDPRSARERLPSLGLLCAGFCYLFLSVRTVFWELVFLFVAATLLARMLVELRRARGRTDALGRVAPGGIEGVLALAAPWAALVYVGVRRYLLPRLAEEPPRLAWWVWTAGAIILLVVQLGRSTARRVARGELADRVEAGRLRRARTIWRRACRSVFGLDLPREEVRALVHVHFRARRGMVGILGPNGAGKTTLLRNLAGILEPSVGVITLGGVRLARLRRYLARFVGYLPQDFGLPDDLTAREYLEYYALHYELRPAARRRERVERLLTEVGLAERADEKIGSYSGGMRQRVAVARTLLRLPPVIIVDEPTVGLDPRERIRFRNLLSRLAEGRVVLFSTHVVEDVEVACERVIVLTRGRVVFDGLPADLARVAQGKVWTARLEPGGEAALAAGALVVDQVPEADGKLRTRVLHGLEPHAAAEPAPPTLQDGYLWLVREPAR